MKNKLIYYIAPAILCCWCFFSIQSCKDPIIQSKNLLTKSDTLNLKKDTLGITITTVAQTLQNSTGIIDGMLGSMSDRNFGITYGSFYAQCALLVASPSFGANPIVDSIVLSLAFDLPYGPCTKPVNISVYELNQDMLATGTYYTSSSFQVKTPPIGYLRNYIPNLTDSTYVYAEGGYEAPQLRINLTKAFGYKLLNADSAILSNDSAFLSYFKGIYVTTSGPVGNGMMFCNLSSSLSKITVFYRTSDSGDSIENPFNFPIAGLTVNHFDNSYNGTPVNSALQNPNTNNQKVFLQGGCGTEAKILINLDSLPKNIGINKAELILAESQPDSQYTVPISLSLLRIDDAGIGQNVDDVSSSNFGGYLQADTVGGVVVNRYHFNISLYMQKLVQGIYNNKGLYLAIPSPNSTPARVVLANPPVANKTYRTYLTVTYTKL